MLFCLSNLFNRQFNFSKGAPENITTIIYFSSEFWLSLCITKDRLGKQTSEMFATFLQKLEDFDDTKCHSVCRNDISGVKDLTKTNITCTTFILWMKPLLMNLQEEAWKSIQTLSRCFVTITTFFCLKYHCSAKYIPLPTEWSIQHYRREPREAFNNFQNRVRRNFP